MRRILAIFVFGFLLISATGIRLTSAQAPMDTAAIEKTRTKIRKIGTGPEARIDVRRRDNTRVKGYIGSAGDDSMVITHRQTGAAQTVDYADITQIKRPGKGISTGNWIAIGASAAAVIITYIIIHPALCDGC